MRGEGPISVRVGLLSMTLLRGARRQGVPGPDAGADGEGHEGRGLHSFTSELNLSNSRTHS
jgi:hypothetical protein